MNTYGQNFNVKFNRHPFSWVRHLLNNSLSSGVLSDNASLIFSKYIYVPQSFIDKRTYQTIPFVQLNEYFLFNAFSELKEGEEVAIHSSVQDFGRDLHIPLIDFGKVERGIIDPMPLRELSYNWGMGFYIYNSGRSFHAYGSRLINGSEWIKFMGSLLLLNKPSGFKLIDERWVGHRIMAGYSALRWSNNSSFYKKTPTYVGYFDSGGIYWDNLNVNNNTFLGGN
ncbi:hypothetical protein [Erwinia sp. B116]|uniref:primase 1D-like protein n=1 Tax=Erwinia sp. B116 TaxID=1561024 RepID=UPI000C78D7A7|nr:hypothetical protein [Erwinia sp. B116]